MANSGGPPNGATQAGAEPSTAIPAIPAMPSAPDPDLYSGPLYLLAEYAAIGHSIGWHKDRKAGPGFVVVRKRSTGRAKIIERFPLTEEGWAGAWQALSDLDASAAATVAATLAKQAARKQAAAARRVLDAESLCVVRQSVFNGGSGSAPLTKGQAYDLRFLGDRIVVCPPLSAKTIVELPYRDVETVEVSGSSPSGSSGEMVVICLFMGLLGAVLGLLVLGLLGLLLGALLFGLVGALIGLNMTKIDTIVCIRRNDGELYFSHHQKRPDALRVELSEPLRAIGSAGAAKPDASDPPGSAGSPDSAGSPEADRRGARIGP